MAGRASTSTRQCVAPPAFPHTRSLARVPCQHHPSLMLLLLCPVFAGCCAGFWTIGTVVQASLAYALLNGKGWRILVLVSTTPYVLLLVLLPFVPESPRFLLVKGRVDAAQQVLRKVLRVCGRELPEGSLQPLLPEGHDDCSADSDAGDKPEKKGEHCLRGLGAGPATAACLPDLH